MKAGFKFYMLHFKQAAGTSRGVYQTRPAWFIFLEEEGKTGIGECAPLPGLSIEDPAQMDAQLQKVCTQPDYFLNNLNELANWPSIRFGLETAWADLQQIGQGLLFPSLFTEGKQGIPINGLIWMGEKSFMQQQIRQKLEQGFRCIKMKIGAIDFETELELLKAIRREFSASEITLRVDANGAFSVSEALEKLKRLAELDLHSIEQPIAAGQIDALADLCSRSPLPIALDEELIGINNSEKKQALLATIRPQYLVLKPSLHGGMAGCDEWIYLAESQNTAWWATSYLESNIGLNAIAQWAATKTLQTEQGLGTGQLFTNNFDSPLQVEGDCLWYRSEKSWNIKF